MAPEAFSKDFPLDVSIFSSAKLTLSGSTDANAAQAILADEKFPDGNIELGHISFSADTGKVSIKPSAVGGSDVSFEIAASAGSGMGVYSKAADSLKALNLINPPQFSIPDKGHRFLLMSWGYTASFSGSASHPIGLLGSVSFGINANRSSLFAVLHGFDPGTGAHTVIEDTLKNWRLPRHVRSDGGDLNILPETWLIAEADGSLAIKIASSLGWNISFARDLQLLGVTHNLSAKVDASVKANLGFNVSGKYIIVVGRENNDQKVRLQLWKQSSKGLDFGFNVNVGIKGSDPQLPANFDDFIKSVFGLHGLQVLNDLREWTDPSTDLGQKLAGLSEQTALDLLNRATGIDPTAEFDKAKKILTDALDLWTRLPDKVSAMLWSYLEKGSSPAITAEFKTFLTALSGDPTKRSEAIAKALQDATFGDSPQGQFLEALAEKGLLALSHELDTTAAVANKVLDVLNGGTIAELQKFINEKLHLDQIRSAVTDAQFENIEDWLKRRLGNFLDKELKLEDLKQVQAAIRALDSKVSGYYKTGIASLTKRYSFEFAETYQKTTSDAALIDVVFDLSVQTASDLYRQTMSDSDLDDLLTRQIKGVVLNQAKLTHEIKRKGTVDIHMPFFDFSSTSLNDSIATLTAEDQGGRLLLYQVDAKDRVTIKNRSASQLSLLASLKTTAGQTVPSISDGSIAYEMRQIMADMRPVDLEARTENFIHDYLGDLFGGGDASLKSFYADLDNALTIATNNQSNHLGDIAISMQLELTSDVLLGWFQARTADQLKHDEMQMSRSLQAAFKKMLPSLYFLDLNQYNFNESIAALLVWASLPISTSINIDSSDHTIKQFNTDKDPFWNWPDIDLRRAVASDHHTVASLAGRLAIIHGQLVSAGNHNSSFFAPSMAGKFIDLALNFTGDKFLSSLLFTEAELISGAAESLGNIANFLDSAGNLPTRAIKTLSEYAAVLTETFNKRVSSIYSGISGPIIGPMLLVESSRALGSAANPPAAMLKLYALRPGHQFDLASFLDGKLPPQSEVALPETLVRLA